MKEVIRQDPSVPLKRVYDSVNRHHVRRGGGDREHIPEFHRIRTSKTRSRLEHVPEVPHSIDDISIHGPSWKRSWSNDRFLLQQDNGWGMLLYATNDNLKNLRECAEIYLDGTFRTCPNPYEQYFTIHGKNWFTFSHNYAASRLHLNFCDRPKSGSSSHHRGDRLQ